MTDELLGTETENQNQLVCRVILRARDWLERFADPVSATVWEIGVWHVETHYSYLEGRLDIRRKGHPGGRVLVTRGRNEADIQLWLDALEACRP